MNSTLEKLDLSRNKFGDKAGEAFATALAENNVLQNLDLSYNRLGDEAGEMLKTALNTNTTLSKLRLGGNTALSQRVADDIILSSAHVPASSRRIRFSLIDPSAFSLANSLNVHKS